MLATTYPNRLHYKPLQNSYYNYTYNAKPIAFAPVKQQQQKSVPRIVPSTSQLIVKKKKNEERSRSSRIAATSLSVCQLQWREKLLLSQEFILIDLECSIRILYGQLPEYFVKTDTIDAPDGTRLEIYTEIEETGEWILPNELASNIYHATKNDSESKRYFSYMDENDETACEDCGGDGCCPNYCLYDENNLEKAFLKGDVFMRRVDASGKAVPLTVEFVNSLCKTK